MNTPLARPNLAVLSIFRRLRVPMLGRLEIAVLRSQWSRYALRRRDLDRSIDRLESLGLVEVDHTRQGFKYVVLTEMGYRSAHSLFGLMESVLTWPRRLARILGLPRRPVAVHEPARRRHDRAPKDARSR